MPELPEVEAQRIWLSRALAGKHIERVRLARLDHRKGVSRSVFRNLKNVMIRSVARRGKLLIMHLSDQTDLVIHFGMSGRLVCRKPSEKHDIFGFQTSGQCWITYNDFRRFGRIWRLGSRNQGRKTVLDTLGPEPLSLAFTAKNILGASNRPIKQALLDQKIVAGLGNIYVCESLFHAGIDPRRLTRSLTQDELARLVCAIKRVLKKAVQRGGSTLDDYRGTEGEAGDFDRYFAVYAKEGQPCPRCTCVGGVTKITQQARSTFFCATLQR